MDGWMILTERLLGLLYFILVGLTQNNNIGILFWERCCVANCIRAFFMQESSWSTVTLRKIRTLPPPNSTPTNKNSRAVRDSVFFTFQHTKSCQSVQYWNWIKWYWCFLVFVVNQHSLEGYLLSINTQFTPCLYSIIFMV